MEKMQVSAFPEMCLYTTDIVFPVEGQETGRVIVTYNPPGKDDDSRRLEVPLRPDTRTLKKMNIDVHGSPVSGYNMGETYNQWFSECFGFSVVLAYLGGNKRAALGNLAPVINSRNLYLRPFLGLVGLCLGVCLAASKGRVKLPARLTTSRLNLVLFVLGIPSIAAKIWATVREKRSKYQLSFADVAPYLIVSETSVENVSARLPEGEEMDLTKFRPNIVVSGAEEAFEEDFWAELSIAPKESEKGKTRLLLTANCARCASLNVDFATGKFGVGESGTVLKKLMKDRRVDKGMKYSPVLGRYAFLGLAGGDGRIRVGDEVIVQKLNTERTVFGEFSSMSICLASDTNRADWPGISN